MILGRLGRLANKYSTMRKTHAPFVAWREFRDAKMAQYKKEKQLQLRLLIRSWRFRCLLRKEKNTKIVKGMRRLNKAVVLRMKRTWTALAQPVGWGEFGRGVLGRFPHPVCILGSCNLH